MDVNAAAGFRRFFHDLPDRRGRNRIHKLHDMIVVVAVMAVVCGADGVGAGGPVRPGQA